MKLYEKVYIPNLKDLQKIILESCPNKTKSDFYLLRNVNCLEIPEFQSMLSYLNILNYMNTTSISIAVLEPYVNMPIHTDTGSHNFSLNIPIQNCDNTWTVWYETEQVPIYIDKPSHYQYSADLCKEIGRIEMSNPYIINTDIPHAAYNPNNSTRILLAVRLRPIKPS
jgi:hypothetical protein